MFDGIDTIVLPVADIAPLRELYVDLLGFTPGPVEPVTDPAWQSLWALPVAPTRTVLLAKPRSHGGWIRLVEAPGLPAPEPAGRPDRPGAYALDFYQRDAATTEALVEAAGWTFRSPATHYALPGTTLPVRERMLEQPFSGLVHASVQYREKGTRCVIDHDGAEQTSEVNAVVFMTDRYAGAKSFAEHVLGGRPYFEGRFDDPAVAEMLALEPGEGFAAALFRGPASRNARLEFGEVMPGGTRSPDPVPRVVASCAMDDLDALAEALAGGEHGVSTGVVEASDATGTTRRLGLRSVYGATFDFFERR
ncbi:hypothetical protein [Aeromicrobium wangtongii]|uniref:VOC family protein n=1 Tax=Aeromicrobium wangtongii TaxID=2969247 RepID=A0ABY5M626_9ACTN|nr:hypothetical protein [Aeromicrobium wangtongii]MCD9198687.1 hypothetical protein [Aeromicrobium wangtongii]UUP13267.1 hypothetical protein NQV15_15635 [Aeromicrobium wangtongii]